MSGRFGQVFSKSRWIRGRELPTMRTAHRPALVEIANVTTISFPYLPPASVTFRYSSEIKRTTRSWILLADSQPNLVSSEESHMLGTCWIARSAPAYSSFATVFRECSHRRGI